MCGCFNVLKHINTLKVISLSATDFNRLCSFCFSTVNARRNDATVPRALASLRTTTKRVRSRVIEASALADLSLIEQLVDGGQSQFNVDS